MCRGRSIFRAALLAAVLLTFLLPVTAWAEEGPQFQFVLSVDGETEEQVQPGDTVTAALHLERTDSDGRFAMLLCRTRWSMIPRSCSSCRRTP